jgi:hypothetical protein
MSVGIVDRSGGVVGWLDGETILDLEERPRGYVLDSGVFDYLGRYIGVFSDGVFLDPSGTTVARLETSAQPIGALVDWETWFRGGDGEIGESDRRA